jgi:hypothetical protein
MARSRCTKVSTHNVSLLPVLSFIQLDHTQALCDQTRPIGRISSWFINFLETVALHNHHLPAVTDNIQVTKERESTHDEKPSYHRLGWMVCVPSVISVADVADGRPPGRSKGA